jgi:hypothetical protein
MDLGGRMGVVKTTAPDTTRQLSDKIEEQARNYFEPKLRALNLGIDQIEQQTLEELETSLDRVNDAMTHPDQFGTLKLGLSVDSGILLAKATSDYLVEVGILPTLLERKALILDRIKLLQPQEQMRDLRKEVAEIVEDTALRDELLRVVDKHRTGQEEMANKIAQESRQVNEALEAESGALSQAVAVGKLETRVESLMKGLDKLKEKAVTKWDVVTIVIAILGALGVLLGAFLGMARWMSGS